MGVFTWPMRIASLDGEKAYDMEAVVDTGTSFSIVPARLLRDLGIVPTRKGVFYLADDRSCGMGRGRSTDHSGRDIGRDSGDFRRRRRRASARRRHSPNTTAWG